MSFISGVINIVDQLSWRLLTALKGSVYGYCELDTPLNSHTLLTKKMDLVSYIEIHGRTALSGSKEFKEACEQLEVFLNSLLEQPRHSLQLCFERNPSQNTYILEQLLDPLKESAKQQSMNTEIIENIFHEREKVFMKYINQERNILAFKTEFKALSNIEKNEHLKQKTNSVKFQLLKENKIPNKLGEMAQSSIAIADRLNIIHQAALESLIKILKSHELGLDVTLLDNHDSLNILRKMVTPDNTANRWRPSLPGDPIPFLENPRIPGQRDNEYYPCIASQLFKLEPKIIGNVVQLGDAYLASVTMELPPQLPERFEKLFSIIPKHINWRLSINMLGGDNYFTKKVKSRLAWAKIFKFTNPNQNEPIVNAAEHLIHSIHKNGEKLIGLRINLSVRSVSKEAAVLDINTCARLLQSWGNIETRFEHGDSWDTYVSSLPGLDSKNSGYTVITPVLDTTILLPLARPTSPWRDGATNLWRTKDGKIYPFQPCSSLQHTWVNLIYATPGSGKSVASNAQNFNLCLTPGLSRLPKIAILDVGPSSQGLIELLKSLLPIERQHEAVYKTLKNDKFSAINPFDTPLGFRYPNSSRNAYITNFLLTLFTEKGQDTIKPGLGELVPDLIHATYRHFSDEKNPKIYVPGLEPIIDEILKEFPEWFEQKELGIEGRLNRLTWWNIVDILAQQACWKEASLAQRNAVPVLGDLSIILSSNQQLKDTHAARGDDEYLFNHLNKMIRTSVTQFPILSNRTHFNTEEARVVALDLADVVNGNDKYSAKAAGLMYMLARQALVADYYFNEEDLKNHHGPTRIYHIEKLNRELGDIKRIVFDEFHRTGKLPSVRNQIIQDMREARKFKVDLTLVSQMDSDFDKEMIELATSIYIFRKPDGEALDRVCKVFDLNASERHALKYEVHGASKNGASFMFKCQTKTGSFSQVLINSIGSIELWAFASTAEDSLIRKLLIKEMPYIEAIKLLAKEFPSGTCTNEIETLIQKNAISKDEAIDSIIKRLTKKIDLRG